MKFSHDAVILSQPACVNCHQGLLLGWERGNSSFLNFKHPPMSKLCRGKCQPQIAFHMSVVHLPAMMRKTQRLWISLKNLESLALVYLWVNSSHSSVFFYSSWVIFGSHGWCCWWWWWWCLYDDDEDKVSFVNVKLLFGSNVTTDTSVSCQNTDNRWWWWSSLW